MFISDHPNNDISKMKSIISANIEFWLNIPINSKNIALIAMLGDKQIDLGPKSIKSRSFSGYIHIPIKFEKKNSPQNLFIMTFESPFERVEVNNGKLINFHQYFLMNKVTVN